MWLPLVLGLATLCQGNHVDVQRSVERVVATRNIGCPFPQSIPLRWLNKHDDFEKRGIMEHRLRECPQAVRIEGLNASNVAHVLDYFPKEALRHTISHADLEDHDRFEKRRAKIIDDHHWRLSIHNAVHLYVKHKGCTRASELTNSLSQIHALRSGLVELSDVSRQKHAEQSMGYILMMRDDVVLYPSYLHSRLLEELPLPLDHPWDVIRLERSEDDTINLLYEMTERDGLILDSAVPTPGIWNASMSLWTVRGALRQVRKFANSSDPILGMGRKAALRKNIRYDIKPRAVVGDVCRWETPDPEMGSLMAYPPWGTQPIRADGNYSAIDDILTASIHYESTQTRVSVALASYKMSEECLKSAEECPVNPKMVYFALQRVRDWRSQPHTEELQDFEELEERMRERPMIYWAPFKLNMTEIMLSREAYRRMKKRENLEHEEGYHYELPDAEKHEHFHIIGHQSKSYEDAEVYHEMDQAHETHSHEVLQHFFDHDHLHYGEDESHAHLPEHLLGAQDEPSNILPSVVEDREKGHKKKRHHHSHDYAHEPFFAGELKDEPHVEPRSKRRRHSQISEHHHHRVDEEVEAMAEPGVDGPVASVVQHSGEHYAAGHPPRSHRASASHHHHRERAPVPIDSEEGNSEVDAVHIQERRPLPKHDEMVHADPHHHGSHRRHASRSHMHGAPTAEEENVGEAPPVDRHRHSRGHAVKGGFYHYDHNSADSSGVVAPGFGDKADYEFAHRGDAAAPEAAGAVHHRKKKDLKHGSHRPSYHPAHPYI